VDDDDDDDDDDDEEEEEEEEDDDDDDDEDDEDEDDDDDDDDEEEEDKDTVDAVGTDTNTCEDDDDDVNLFAKSLAKSNFFLSTASCSYKLCCLCNASNRCRNDAKTSSSMESEPMLRADICADISDSRFE
jgi:hypothetical protein